MRSCQAHRPWRLCLFWLLTPALLAKVSCQTLSAAEPEGPSDSTLLLQLPLGSASGNSPSPISASSVSSALSAGEDTLSPAVDVAARSEGNLNPSPKFQGRFGLVSSESLVSQGERWEFSYFVADAKITTRAAVTVSLVVLFSVAGAILFCKVASASYSQHSASSSTLLSRYYVEAKVATDRAETARRIVDEWLTRRRSLHRANEAADRLSRFFGEVEALVSLLGSAVVARLFASGLFALAAKTWLAALGFYKILAFSQSHPAAFGETVETFFIVFVFCFAIPVVGGLARFDWLHREREASGILAVALQELVTGGTVQAEDWERLVGGPSGALGGLSSPGAERRACEEALAEVLRSLVQAVTIPLNLCLLLALLWEQIGVLVCFVAIGCLPMVATAAKMPRAVVAEGVANQRALRRRRALLVSVLERPLSMKCTGMLESLCQQMMVHRADESRYLRAVQLFGLLVAAIGASWPRALALVALRSADALGRRPDGLAVLCFIQVVGYAVCSMTALMVSLRRLRSAWPVIAALSSTASLPISCCCGAPAQKGEYISGIFAGVTTYGIDRSEETWLPRRLAFLLRPRILLQLGACIVLICAMQVTDILYQVSLSDWGLRVETLAGVPAIIACVCLSCASLVFYLASGLAAAGVGSSVASDAHQTCLDAIASARVESLEASSCRLGLERCLISDLSVIDAQLWPLATTFCGSSIGALCSICAALLLIKDSGGGGLAAVGLNVSAPTALLIGACLPAALLVLARLLTVTTARLRKGQEPSTLAWQLHVCAAIAQTLIGLEVALAPARSAAAMVALLLVVLLPQRLEAFVDSGAALSAVLGSLLNVHAGAAALECEACAGRAEDPVSVNSVLEVDMGPLRIQEDDVTSAATFVSDVTSGAAAAHLACSSDAPSRGIEQLAFDVDAKQLFGAVASNKLSGHCVEVTNLMKVSLHPSVLPPAASFQRQQRRCLLELLARKASLCAVAVNGVPLDGPVLEEIRKTSEQSPKAAVRLRVRGGWLRDGAALALQAPLFGHQVAGRVLLTGDVTIKACEHVVVVGETSAMVSALLLAVARIREPRTGAVQLDDVDATSVGLRTFRANVVLVPAEPPIIKGGSLREHLDPDREFADADLLRVMKKLGLASLAVDGLAIDVALAGLLMHSRRPDEGMVTLARRLALARAVLRQPPLVLIDAPSAEARGPPTVGDEAFSRCVRAGLPRSTVLEALPAGCYPEAGSGYDKVLTIVDRDKHMSLSAAVAVGANVETFHEECLNSRLSAGFLLP